MLNKEWRSFELLEIAYEAYCRLFFDTVGGFFLSSHANCFANEALPC